MKIRFHENDWTNDQFLEHISKNSCISLDKLNNINLLIDPEKQEIEEYRQLFYELLSPISDYTDLRPEGTEFMYEHYRNQLIFGQFCLEIENTRLEKETQKDKLI